MENDQATAIKDSDMKEAGLFAARLVYGGSSIPFTMTWAFNNWGITNPTNAMKVGKREWVRNRFFLDSIFTVVRQAPSSTCANTFSPINHDLFYKPGDTVNLEIISTWNSPDVTFTTAAGGITSFPAILVLESGPTPFGTRFRHTMSFTWLSSPTENVGPDLAPRFDYYWVTASFGSPSQGNVSCGLFHDDVLPTAATFSLAANNPSPAVVIDWSTNKGSDNSDNTLPAPHNNGIKEYVLYRDSNPIATVPYGTFFYIDDNYGAGFTHGTVLNYQLRTYDQAGNYASSAPVVTTIDLPISNPARFNAQWNQDLDGPSADENPVAAYGNTTISWGHGAPYSGTITSFEILRSTSPATGYTTIATGIGASTCMYTIDWTTPASVADTYWFKVLTRGREQPRCRFFSLARLRHRPTTSYTRKQWSTRLACGTCKYQATRLVSALYGKLEGRPAACMSISTSPIRTETFISQTRCRLCPFSCCMS